MTATEIDLKRWRTAQARLLLAGYRAELIERDDGRPELIVNRWAWTKSFADVGEAEKFFSRVSGIKPGFATEQDARGSFLEHHSDRPPNSAAP